MNGTYDERTWDPTQYFSGLDSPDFNSAFDRLEADVTALAATVDERDRVEQTLEQLNQTLALARLLRAFIASFVSTDSRNELALAKQSELARPLTALSQVTTRFTALIGTMDVEALVNASAVCKEHEFPLKRAKFLASRQMSASEEALAAELYDSGAGAWGRLQSNWTSQIEVEFEGKRHPMSHIRNLASAADQATRRRAYEAELASWKGQSLGLAAAMNSIKAQSALLAKRRGWDSVLDEAVFGANIDRESLEAMMEAARDSFPAFRRYLRAKSKLIGNSGALPFYDILAPVGADGEWSYERGKEFVLDKFGSYSQKLAGLAQQSFDERWIDVDPRPGKVGGAFCMGTEGGRSLVLLNYKPTFTSVSTLAHELGHAYHNLCLAEKTEALRQIPMTLAETASIFCETIIKKAALKEATGGERLGILEGSLQGSCQVVVDITSRFLFEKETLERRPDRELSTTELCDAMARAQLATYGDGLDSELLHPHMWAAKPHYYSTRAYYNFPYMFGLLFALGVYAVYESEPNGFHERYDSLLADTGAADAHTLGQRFGIDVRRKEFWAQSLATVEQDIDEFVASVG